MPAGLSAAPGAGWPPDPEKRSRPRRRYSANIAWVWGLSSPGILHRRLRRCEFRLDILDGLLPRLRREILRDPQTQSRNLRGRIRAGRRGSEGGEDGEVLKLRADRRLVSLRPVLKP